MNLYLYNTSTKSKELFKPIVDGKVSMYVCGPTVYSAPHIGNGLSVVVFDLLYRILRQVYGVNNVNYVRNITDVDDKINNMAIQRGIPINQLTEEVCNIFHDNTRELNCLAPNHEPKVTGHIAEIIELIEILINRGFAYVIDGHVYFEVRKFKNYGDLANRTLDELFAGARVEIAETKKDPADFVLWKPADDKMDSSGVYDSPWGLGRPGWHIECSAMSKKYLGVNFDIHGGGLDLIFPHHTNEIAQSCAAHEASIYAKYWVHNGFLTVEGEKMSKSLGNFITIEDLIKSGIRGEVIRYHLLSSHYRSPIDWNSKSVEDAQKALSSMYRATEIIQHEENDCNLPAEFMNALLDDMNTPLAYRFIHQLLNNYFKSTETEEKIDYARQIRACARFLGLLKMSHEDWFRGDANNEEFSEIEELIVKRLEAKKNKDFALADKIRAQLEAKSVVLEDKIDGSTTWRKY